MASGGQIYPPGVDLSGNRDPGDDRGHHALVHVDRFLPGAAAVLVEAVVVGAEDHGLEQDGQLAAEGVVDAQEYGADDIAADLFDGDQAVMDLEPAPPLLDRGDRHGQAVAQDVEPLHAASITGTPAIWARRT